jgi:tRNA wybutosine-synthesizing protein 2
MKEKPGGGGLPAGPACIAPCAGRSKTQERPPGWARVARPTPHEEIRTRLEPHLGESVRALPRRWERLGDVLVVRGIHDRFPDASLVARTYAEVLDARIVLEDLEGITGAKREPTMKHLWGDGPTETTLVQHGIHYTLDPARVMFSSGNLEERARMGRVQAEGETVVDLFAGIGYFTLPLLVKAGARRAIACELNPVSAHYLEQNARRNGVLDRLEVRVGDCRENAPRAVADRVVSGWFPHGHTYLQTALDALRDEGGMLHYHDTAHAERPEELREHLEAACEATGRPLEDVDLRVVKNYAPGVVHVVADAQVGPRAPQGETPIGAQGPLGSKPRTENP